MAMTYAEYLDRFLDTRLAICAERVEERATDADGLRSERQRLEDVARPAHTAVHKDVKRPGSSSLLQCLGNLDQDFETRTRRVELTAAVVGKDDALHTRLVRQQCIFGSGDALEDDGHCQDN